MPTIDIPDKICPHCGGIRWKIEYEKRPYWIQTRYRCAVKSQERVTKCKEKNKEQYLVYAKKYTKKLTKSGYWKREKYKENQLTRYYEDRDKLTDRFVKHRLAHDKCISWSDIPQEMIELKRKQLLLKRKIKNNG